MEKIYSILDKIVYWPWLSKAEKAVLDKVIPASPVTDKAEKKEE